MSASTGKSPSVKTRSPDPVIIVGLRLHRRRGGRWRVPAMGRWIRSISGVEHRAAAVRELWRILPQAGHDAVGVGNLIAAEPPDVGRARHLLFHGPAVFVGTRVGRQDNATSQRAQKESIGLHSHDQPSLQKVGRRCRHADAKMRLREVRTPQEIVRKFAGTYWLEKTFGDPAPRGSGMRGSREPVAAYRRFCSNLLLFRNYPLFTP